jgi:hypothetical protein
MSGGKDIAVLRRSAVRQIAYSRQMIEESKRMFRVIQAHCERMQRQLAESRALLQGVVQPALVSRTTPSR